MQTELEKQERRSNRRARTASDLIAAAQTVLAAKGYHGAKVADIAREAGVGVGTFYLYYTTKEAVFLELVEEALTQLKAQMSEANTSSSDPADISRARIRVFFSFAEKRRNLFRIVFGHEASFHDVVRNAQELFVADIVENIRVGMAAGTFRQGNPEIWAQAIVGMCIQTVTWWLEHDDTTPAESVAAQVAEIAQHGMMSNGA